MAASAPQRPLVPAFIIGLAAQLLFSINLARPHKLVFDEIYYVPAARALLALSGPVNIEHPLLGKELIALGIALLGDTSAGWRVMSAYAGTAVVMGMFAIAWLLFGRLRPAVVAAVLTALNFTVFVQARIAMLDGFMAAFVVTGIAALLWAMRSPSHSVWRRWLLGAVLLGLAVGAKWTAVPYVALAGLAFLIVRLHDARGRPALTALDGTGQPHWAGLPTIPALLALGIVSIATYLLTFAPAFFYASEPMTLRALLPFQARMWAEQTQVLPAHTYQSRWWSWPLDIRPIWYLYERADDAQRGILMIGNPAILWGGLIAVLACLYGGVRDRAPKLLAVGLLWVGGIAVWAIIPKSIGFFYYYYLPSIFVCLAIAAAFDHYDRGRRYWDEAFIAFSGVIFVYFYPILSAAALSGPQAFKQWMWLPSWP